MATSVALSSLVLPANVLTSKNVGCDEQSAQQVSRAALVSRKCQLLYSSHGRQLQMAHRRSTPICRASAQPKDSERLVLKNPAVENAQAADGRQEAISSQQALQLSAASAAFLIQGLVTSLPAEALEFPAFGIFTSDEVESVAYIIVAAGAYLFVAPPIIYNFLRLRWYNRSTLETAFQYFLFFLFFPAMLLWAPFINFRRFPRDPSEM